MLNLSFHPFPEQETLRLRLRQIKPADVESLFALRSDREVLTYLDRAPAASLEEVGELIQRIQDDWVNNVSINWAISLPGQEDLIGTIGFWKIDKAHHRAEIGYMLLPAYHRQGLMQEAMRAVLAYGFRQMKTHSVEANVNPNNMASIRLLRKFGFVQEAYFKENYYYAGTFVDSAIYSLLVSKWGDEVDQVVPQK
jgi:ribosomal-protein-alanine N-acetyltransferase